MNSQDYPSSKHQISSSLTNFYRLFMGPILMAIPFFLAFSDIGFNGKTRNTQILTLIFLFCVTAAIYFYLWNISHVWKDENFIYFKNRKGQNKIAWKNVEEAWQEQPLNLFRFLYISFEDELGVIQQFYFVGHFEIDIKGKHHPEITRLLKRIKQEL